ncbi:MAG TPA: sulfatase-like hydrolase/transferase [Candidatus Paceibacterota bacterium]|nr:sulfatase-like hydrolase/transferase [Verrucomicrobiota bacterium]HRY47181.1 sulfatase-like hydrolase/transferase [Candidatus Paceibacterota bacterium]
MKKSLLLLVLLVVLDARLPVFSDSVAASSTDSSGTAQKPNIVILYADDLGYGDLGCYGATAVRTPHADRLAKEGLRFTSAYSSSATCTPSRYSMLTGEYAFRKKGTGVLPGDAALIIEPGRVTMASLLKRAGYTTGVIGKWHLGLGKAGEVLDWNRDIKPGPREIGYDYSFIMAATGDRVPCVYVENHRVVGLVSEDPIQVSYREPFPGELNGVTHRDRLKLDWSHGHNQAVINGIGRIGFMRGGKAALWKDEDMADVFVRQALAFIDREKDKPFFLCFNTHDVHVPRVPHSRFVGMTPMGARGDAIAQFDYCVGEILRKLDQWQLTENTLVILTSDNGPVLDDGYRDEANEKLGTHKPAGLLRAGKYSLFEGGTRVPFLVRWPRRVRPGVSDALFSQVDLPATLAALAGRGADTAPMPDSMNLLPALLGESTMGRRHVIQHANRLAVRQGSWKFILPGQVQDGLGPWNQIKVPPPGLLFDLSSDPQERRDIAAEHPERVKALGALLEETQNRLSARVPVVTPNILWLIAEDIGPQLGCYGTREVWTPNLDRLAAEGVRYARFYNGNVCSPSRSAFNTGMYATSIGAHNHRTTAKKPLPQGVQVISDWMRQAGYFAANLRELPASCGFKGTGKTDWNFLYEGKAFDSDRWNDLRARQPFYAQLNFSETHRTYVAPKKANPSKVDIPPYYPDHPVTREDWARYLDAISELDRKIGLVLAALEQEGLADNTVVVFFGDNGQSHVRGKQFCYEEGLHVPCIIRWPKNIPLPPRFTPGSTDNRLLHAIDLAPTMLALAGASKPPKMQGRIFLGDRCEPERPYVFGHRDRCDMTVMRIRTVRDDRYRYIRNYTPHVPFLAFNEYKQKQYPVWNLLPELNGQGKLTAAQAFLCHSSMPEEELYDLQEDPWEVHNLAQSTPSNTQAVLVRLRAVLEQWIEETDDQGRQMETLEELIKAEPRFVPERDWRPPPGGQP